MGVVEIVFIGGYSTSLLDGFFVLGLLSIYDIYIYML